MLNPDTGAGRPYREAADRLRQQLDEEKDPLPPKPADPNGLEAAAIGLLLMALIEFVLWLALPAHRFFCPQCHLRLKL
jgi:hypothetical protein